MERPKILIHPDLCYPHPLIGRFGRLYIVRRVSSNRGNKDRFHVPATLLEIGFQYGQQPHNNQPPAVIFIARVMDEYQGEEVYFKTSGSSKRWWWMKENHRQGRAQLMWAPFKMHWAIKEAHRIPKDFQWYKKPLTSPLKPEE